MIRFRRRRVTPLAALGRGLAAGLAGSLAQDVFFALTKKIAPESPKEAFEPPEPQQKEERATETAARRVVEGAMKRELPKKSVAGRVVHYLFGGAWGGAYGLLAGSFRPAATLGGGAAFGSLVWLVSDDFILPVFKLAAWPRAYPLKNHAYAVAAHLVYGATVYGVYKGITRAVG